jgi:hypothetical protein
VRGGGLCRGRGPGSGQQQGHHKVRRGGRAEACGGSGEQQALTEGKEVRG